MSFVKEIVNRNQGKAVEITKEIFQIKPLIKVGAKVSSFVVLKLPSSEVSWFWERGMLKFWNKLLFKETCAILVSTRGFGVKNRNFGGFFPG
jgi:hypothetical protein